MYGHESASASASNHGMVVFAKVKFLRKFMVAILIVSMIDNRNCNCNCNGDGDGGDIENLTDFGS